MFSLYLIFFSFSFFYCVNAAGYLETVCAAVIYRHGDRTPVDIYPTDPWRNESLWPVKFGELTNIGKRQHYALGKWLRKRYSHLLSDVFDPAEVYVRSTDIDRTLMSAQANLAGMYPPVAASVWNKDLMWQPIPVHTVPVKSDAVLSMSKNCPVYNIEMEKLLQSKDYRNHLSKYQKVMDYLSAYTGRKIKDYYDILDIYTTLRIERLYNFTLPNWTKTVYPDQMKEPACHSFAVPVATPLLARLRAGPLITEIVSKMTEAAYDPQNKLKVSIYSGHDLTIGVILSALRLFDGNCPEYTSTVFFELLKDNTTSTHYIRLSYRNTSEIVEPHILSIPYCGEICPLERFTKLYENLLNVHFDKECEKKMLLPVLSLIALVISSFTMMASFFVTRKINKDRAQDKTSDIHPKIETLLLTKA